jgi:hypothetical protein
LHFDIKKNIRTKKEREKKYVCLFSPLEQSYDNNSHMIELTFSVSTSPTSTGCVVNNWWSLACINVHIKIEQIYDVVFVYVKHMSRMSSYTRSVADCALE